MLRGIPLAFGLLLVSCYVGRPIQDSNIVLNWSVIQNNPGLVKQKLREGALVDGDNINAFSPLMIASWNGNLEIVKILIDSGANINQLNQETVSPILFATTRGNRDVAEYLLSKGAKPDSCPKNQLNAVQMSQTLGFSEIGSLFSNAGYSVNNLELDTSRSTDEILSIIRVNTIQLKIIYDKQLHFNPGFKGKVVVKFSIDPEGKVVQITKVSSTTRIPEFNRSIVSDISKWKFGKINGKSNDVVTVPFTFDE